MSAGAATDATPTVVLLKPGDLGYIVDALIDAADRRRSRPGSIHERIADHLDYLALVLHEAKPDRIEAGRG